MRKLLAWIVVVVVLFTAPAVRADPGTLYVDDDGVCAGNSPCYTGIQSAIDAANPGDTVYVHAGTYYECLAIDKALDLLAEDLDTTIINGEGCQEPLVVSAEGVVVGAVNAQPIGSVVYSNTEYVDDDALCGGNTPCHASIQAGVNAADPYETVYIYAGIYHEHVTINKPIALMGEDRETTIIDGGGSGNVVYVTANYVTVGDVTVRNGYNGIALIGNWSIHHFTFTNGVVTDNSFVGIHAPHSNSTGAYHLLEDCVIANSGYHGLYAHQFGQSMMRNCEAFGNHGLGLDPAWGGNSLITGNRVHDNFGYGIMLDSMWSTTAENNEVWNNQSHGIIVHYAAYDVIIRQNVVRTPNNVVGIAANPWVRNCRIYHNDVFGTTKFGFDHAPVNYWDNGYPSGGNYWSNYTGVDNYSGPNQDQPGSDGIGDTPYVLIGNHDHYPLMRPWNLQPPVAEAGGPYTAGEGSTISFDASGSFDPDGNIVAYEWDLDNDGEYDDAMGVTTNVFFGDNGSFTVGLKVTDGYGLSDADTAEVTILNVAPTPSISGPTGAEEGSPVALVGSATDPAELNDTVSLEWSVTKDGSPFASGTGADIDFTPHDNGTYVATLTASDEDGGSASADHSVAVANVAPTLGPVVSDPANPVVAVSTPVSFGASFSDPAGAADEPYSCNFDWDGDGTADETIEASYGACDTSHAYEGAGVYAVRLTAADKDGAASDESVFEFVVVYDPSAGFVTGGGWIDSPAGAYKVDPGLTGRANFGFVSKYQKGKSVPTGQTEFQFQVADLSFHSDRYEWLVVSQNGTNAQFKGDGTINGQGAPNGGLYKFMIWATDGSPDTFRIRLWYEYNGSEIDVYDNGTDQPIGGGSIVIHKSK